MGWTDNKEKPMTYNRNGATVDSMDAYFRKHDNAYTDAKGSVSKIAQADQILLSDLKTLPTTNHIFWGNIYISSPSGAPIAINVFSLSVLNFNRVYMFCKQMPFSEYARRQSVIAFQIKTAW